MCNLCRGKLQIQQLNAVKRTSELRMNIRFGILQLKQNSGHVFEKKIFLDVCFQQYLLCVIEWVTPPLPWLSGAELSEVSGVHDITELWLFNSNANRKTIWFIYPYITKWKLTLGHDTILYMTSDISLFWLLWWSNAWISWRSVVWRAHA